MAYSPQEWSKESDGQDIPGTSCQTHFRQPDWHPFRRQPRSDGFLANQAPLL